MQKSFVNAAGFIVLAAVLFLLGVVCAYIFRAPVPNDWWSPLSALATTGAVVVAYWAIYKQKADAIERDRNADAAILLGFQQLAKELTRVCTLSGYQNDSEENMIFFPDISAEFAEITKMLAELPMEKLAVHGQISRCMHLRRIANENCMLWKGITKRDGSFWRENRIKLTDLEKRARKECIALGEYLQEFAPDIYLKNKDLIEKS
jgi:hypothetical protein